MKLAENIAKEEYVHQAATEQAEQDEGRLCDHALLFL